MMWPAFFNRYPLLYPDSMTYLANGSPVARAVFLHQLSDYYGMRSFIYSLGILLFHWNATLWPIVALQAMLTACVIWLVVRSLLPQLTVFWYLSLMMLLSLLTSASWFASLIMPDILGPLLYLCIYLLVFARDTLSRPERIAVAVIACWAVASHATHLMLGAGICLLLAALWAIFRKGFMSGRLKALGEIAAIVMLAAIAQLALNFYLYGKPSLNGERPPFLTARLIADGPGRWYLEQHCGETKFAGCGHLRELRADSDQFLWADDGVWKTSSSRSSGTDAAGRNSLRARHTSHLSTRSIDHIWCELLATAQFLRNRIRPQRLDGASNSMKHFPPEKRNSFKAARPPTICLLTSSR